MIAAKASAHVKADGSALLDVAIETGITAAAGPAVGALVVPAVSDGSAMVQAVLAGGGLCQLPTWLILDKLANGKLVPVLEQVAGAGMPIHAIWSPSPYLQPKLRVVIDALAKAAKVSRGGFLP